MRTPLKFGRSEHYSESDAVGHGRQHGFRLVSPGSHFQSLPQPLHGERSRWGGTDSHRPAPASRVSEPQAWQADPPGPASCPLLTLRERKQAVPSTFCPRCRLMAKINSHCFKPQRFWAACCGATDGEPRPCHTQVRKEKLRPRQVHSVLDGLTSIWYGTQKTGLLFPGLWDVLLRLFPLLRLFSFNLFLFCFVVVACAVFFLLFLQE